MLRTALVLLASLLLTQLHALDTAGLPADTRWTVQLDAKALLSGNLGAWIKDQATRGPAKARLALLRTITGCNPLTDIDRVVLAGPDAGEEKAVLLAYGRFDSERLATVAEAAPEHQTFAHGTRTIHRWRDDQSGQIRFGLLDGTVLIIGRELDRVAAVLDVRDGAAVGVKPGTLPEPPTATGTVVISGAAEAIDAWQNLKPEAAIFKQARSIALVLSESGDALTIQANLAAADAETATQIEQVINGFIALGRMQADKLGDKPLAKTALAGVTVNREGTVVTVGTTLPAAEVTKALDAKRAAHRGDG